MTSMTTETKTPPPQPDKPLSPLALIARGMEQRREQFRMMLPMHISAEHFERVVMTAVNTDPELATADRRSLFNACARAAGDGLLPDKREGALVIFKDASGAKLVTWMPMVYGLIKKIYQSGEIESVGARIVYQREIDDKRFRFIIEDGQEKLYHDPMLWGDRGEKVLAYAYARRKSGHVDYLTVHKDSITKRRKAARTDKVWAAWEEEMWIKTAIRAIASKLPLSNELISSLQRDEEVANESDEMRQKAIAALGQVPDDDGVIDVEPTPQPPTQQIETGAAPAPPSEPEPQPETTLPSKQSVSAQEFVKEAVEGLKRFTSASNVNGYAQVKRDALVKMQPPEIERTRLFSMFNKAVADRLAAIEAKDMGE